MKQDLHTDATWCCKESSLLNMIPGLRTTLTVSQKLQAMSLQVQLEFVCFHPQLNVTKTPLQSLALNPEMILANGEVYNKKAWAPRLSLPVLHISEDLGLGS